MGVTVPSLPAWRGHRFPNRDSCEHVIDLPLLGGYLGPPYGARVPTTYPANGVDSASAGSTPLSASWELAGLLSPRGLQGPTRLSGSKVPLQLRRPGALRITPDSQAAGQKSCTPVNVFRTSFDHPQPARSFSPCACVLRTWDLKLSFSPYIHPSIHPSSQPASQQPSYGACFY